MASLQSARKFPGRIHGSAEVPGMEKFGEKVVKNAFIIKIIIYHQYSRYVDYIEHQKTGLPLLSMIQEKAHLFRGGDYHV